MRRTHLLRIPLIPMAATVPKYGRYHRRNHRNDQRIFERIHNHAVFETDGAYHRREKPENTERLIVSESLKEKTIKHKNRRV